VGSGVMTWLFYDVLFVILRMKDKQECCVCRGRDVIPSLGRSGEHSLVHRSMLLCNIPRERHVLPL